MSEKAHTSAKIPEIFPLWGHLIYSLQSWCQAPSFQLPLYPKRSLWRDFPCPAQCCVIFQHRMELFPAVCSWSRGSTSRGASPCRTGHSRTQEDGTGTLVRTGCLSLALHSLWRAAQSQPMTSAGGSTGWGFLCFLVKVRGVLMDRNFPPSLALPLLVSICQLSNEAKQ